MIELGIIPKGDLRKWSPFFIPLIHDACRKGMPDLAPEEIVDRLYDDPSFAAALIADDSAPCGVMVLEAGEDNINVTIIAGNMPIGWVDPVLESLDRVTACTGRRRITCGGRPGWAKLLKGKFSSRVVCGVPVYEREIS